MPKAKEDGQVVFEPSSNTTSENNSKGTVDGVSFDLQASILTDGAFESRIESYFRYQPPSYDPVLWYMMRVQSNKMEEAEWLKELDAAFDEARVFTAETLPPQIPARFGKPSAPVNEKSCIKIDQSKCPTEEQ